MARPKTILVACGTAVATSTVVATAIEETMQERGIPVQIRQCKATELPSLVADADLVVSTTPVPADLGKPVVKGLPFLTGIGKAQALDEIERHLRG
ncbi:PTS sugar transporter subunit IIB [Pseudoroseomonas cervicalis]|uniref:PTS system, Lactose/Cellobiose specific IIB subunit n=1 Tax=Pseudoroseomonas cervicalis ATCC 49957 TaxID=525371 RepID=D5RTP2_9PROT|nr:PTS sugar transporter subunit IIB [Pseudoroseomonas cervicalis]EFH09326.1 PTS system, Lactose/Cellobiose specific IIB subunit [Pseudoroseomonas cervicalis ATCC 49957]MDQ1078043.1 PTS system galactitol-specific IIB component [Pseudoroseomonas cervicalis]WBV45314.1 PTS sugar transporter subunit IIB [Pseudoroseomonas cervicalis]